MRIRQDLKTRGIGATIIARVLTDLNERMCQEESLSKLLAARVERVGKPESVAEVKKLFDYCFRQGYPRAQIRQAIEPLFNEADW
jgi:SOS response regulatory protein OraA/RecX